MLSFRSNSWSGPGPTTLGIPSSWGDEGRQKILVKSSGKPNNQSVRSKKPAKPKNTSMCFSARVKQKFDHLCLATTERRWTGRRSKTFSSAAQKVKMSKVARDLQRNYQNPETAVQKRTAAYIAQYLRAKKTEVEEGEGLRSAQASCDGRGIPHEEGNSRRPEKMYASQRTRAKCCWTALLICEGRNQNNEDARIFPMMYAPVLISEHGKTVIPSHALRVSFRWKAGGLRPSVFRAPTTLGATVSMIIWTKVYGRNHAIMVISGFYENVRAPSIRTSRACTRRASKESRTRIRSAAAVPGHARGLRLGSLDQTGLP